MSLRGLRALAALAALGALGGTGCSRPRLPAPELPLVASEDAPFRAKRPALPAEAAATPLDGLAFETAVLPNGLSLWVASKPGAADTTLLLVARDGGYLDSPLSAELLSLTTRALVEGGTRWPDGRIVAPPVLNGRRVGFGAGPSSARLSMHVLTSSLPSAFKILSRTLLHPAFDDLDGAKLAELKVVQDYSSSLSRVLLEVTSAAAYGQPLAEQLTGVRIEEVRRQDTAAVQRCYREVFRPDGLALVAVGDVTLEELQDMAAAELGAPVSGKPPKPGPARTAPQLLSQGRRLHFLPQRDREQAHVLVLQPAPPSRAVEDELPFALLAELAVGAVRSRANTALRHEQGVTYGVHPSLTTGMQLGLLMIDADFEEDQAASAINALLAMLEDLSARPVAAAELAAAKLALRAELERTAYSSVGLARLAAEVYASRGTPEQLWTLPERLSAVTAADVQRVARKYLRPRDVEIGVSGSYQLADELSSLGELELYEIDRE